MTNGDRLQFSVVVAEMDNHEAWLQAFDGIQVELLPLFGPNVGICHHHRVKQNVFFRERGSQLHANGSCREKREVVVVGNLDVRGDEFWSGEEKRSHVTVEMSGMNPQSDRGQSGRELRAPPPAAWRGPRPAQSRSRTFRQGRAGLKLCPPARPSPSGRLSIRW